jgi:flagellin-specific chaperone FliS
VKNYQPIQITIASPSEQTLALAERCQKLEEYCRELIRTNKILDCENRLAIA